MTVNSASGAVPARRVINTDDAVFFEPTADNQEGIVWVYPKTKTVVKRYAADPTYLQVDRLLRDVRLPADPGTLHPSWAGRQALFYQVTAREECVLKAWPTMQFVQQWVKAKGITIQGTQRSSICSFTFKLRNETPDMVRQLEAEAAAGTLVAHLFSLELSVASLEPLPWRPLHAALVDGGMAAGSPRSPELAAFELGVLGELGSLRQQSAELRQSFLTSAMKTLFGWNGVSPEVRLSAPPPSGQYDFPSTTQNIPL
ncbi:MAG TPA: hypothetical protein VF664_21240 [Cystobacter sp.]